MKNLDVETLIAACADDSFESGISITAMLEPLGGPGAPVKPAVYEGGNYQHDKRWWGDGGDRMRMVVGAIVIDNIASQANRMEAALRQFRAKLRLPELVIDFSSVESLPSHLPRKLSSFEFPHRNGDAYLRDAELDGKAFLKTELGQAIFAASASSPEALFEWMPQALLYGFWQSHLGKKRQQTKLARSWTSEIVGIKPATVETKTHGLKGDPYNLSIDHGVAYDEDDLIDWQAGDAQRKGSRKAQDSLAEIGHGQVPVAGAPAGVSFEQIVQQATVSFAGLRRVDGGDPKANATGRALLVAIGIAAHLGAFGRSFSLRSGCELRPAEQHWSWRGATDDEPVAVPTFDEAVALVAGCAAAAESAGLPVGERWAEPVVLEPQPKLATVVAKAWPSLDEEG